MSYYHHLIKSGASYTARTTAFATATAITDTTILNALNTFDLGLISNSLDTNLQSIHPFVGGTATTHKYNFMNPVDSDAAFRLIFNGGWIHSTTGAKPNGTNAYADTKWNIATQMTNGIDSAAVGIYLRTDMIAAQQFLLANSTSYFGLYTGGATIYPSINDGNSVSFTPTSKKGLFQTSRTNTTSIISSVKAEQFTRTQSTTSIGNTNIFLACQNNGGTPSGYATQEIAFSYLTNTKYTLAQQLIINTLVQDLQTSLTRNV